MRRARLGRHADREPRRSLAARDRSVAQRRCHRGRRHAPNACALVGVRDSRRPSAARGARAQRTRRGEEARRPHRRWNTCRVRDRRGDAGHRRSRRGARACVRRCRARGRGCSRAERARHRARGLGASGRSVPLRRLPAPQGRRPHRAARRDRGVRMSPSCSSSRPTASRRRSRIWRRPAVRNARSRSGASSRSCTKK